MSEEELLAHVDGLARALHGTEAIILLADSQHARDRRRDTMDRGRRGSRAGRGRGGWVERGRRWSRSSRRRPWPRGWVCRRTPAASWSPTPSTSASGCRDCGSGCRAWRSGLERPLRRAQDPRPDEGAGRLRRRAGGRVGRRPHRVGEVRDPGGGGRSKPLTPSPPPRPRRPRIADSSPTRRGPTSTGCAGSTSARRSRPSHGSTRPSRSSPTCSSCAGRRRPAGRTPGEGRPGPVRPGRGPGADGHGQGRRLVEVPSCGHGLRAPLRRAREHRCRARRGHLSATEAWVRDHLARDAKVDDQARLRPRGPGAGGRLRDPRPTSTGRASDDAARHLPHTHPAPADSSRSTTPRR